ncbi:MAG: hypothetical protein ACRETO_08600 [Gammaproteobacteria bacterium]
MKTIDLSCPECNEINELLISDLVNGKQIMCQHCAEPLILSRYRDYFDNPPIWHLEKNELLEEEEQRA